MSCCSRRLGGAVICKVCWQPVLEARWRPPLSHASSPGLRAQSASLPAGLSAPNTTPSTPLTTATSQPLQPHAATQASSPVWPVACLAARMPATIGASCEAAPPSRRPLWQAAADLSHGGYLREVDRFDAAFFDNSAAEAQRMDPQQRLLLQTVWHALEDAGLPPVQLRGQAVGVFVGAFAHDYEWLDRDQRLHAGTAASAAQVAQPGQPLLFHWQLQQRAGGPLACVFDFRGPALTVHACSSSMAALHPAVRSLQARAGL